MSVRLVLPILLLGILRRHWSTVFASTFASPLIVYCVSMLMLVVD